MKDLIIIGAGGFGREVSWLVENINAKNSAWNLLGFVDDDQSILGKVLDGYPVLGGMDWLCSYSKDIFVVCSIAKPSIRKNVVSKCRTNKHISFATLVDPHAIVGRNIEIEEGCIVCAGTIITIDATIKQFSIVNLSCTIGHDAILDEYTTLYPTVNVSGHVAIGKGAEIGTGSQIIQGLSIGEDTVIGAGSVVIRDIPSYCTAVGDPAKPVKFHAN